MAVRRLDVDRNLPISSNLRLYNVFEDDDRTRFLNVFRSYIVNEKVSSNENMFEYYMVEDDDWLDNISARFYNSPYLWWVVALFNEMTNPFEELEEGMTLKILKYEYLFIIFDDVSSIASL